MPYVENNDFSLIFEQQKPIAIKIHTHPLAKLCRPTESASSDLSIDVHN
jgi:hypothetical protein